MGQSFDSNDVWELLSSGGMTVTRKLTNDGDFRVSISKYNPLSDPRGAIKIANLLATAVAELAPTVIVAWEELEDAVLGFAVGAELGVPVVRAFDMEGLVWHGGIFPEEPRGVLVTDAIREDSAIEALKTLLLQSGGVLAGIVSIVRLNDLTTDVATKSLVSASDGPIAEIEGV